MERTGAGRTTWRLPGWFSVGSRLVLGWFRRYAVGSWRPSTCLPPAALSAAAATSRTASPAKDASQCRSYVSDDTCASRAQPSLTALVSASTSPANTDNYRTAASATSSTLSICVATALPGCSSTSAPNTTNASRPRKRPMRIGRQPCRQKGFNGHQSLGVVDKEREPCREHEAIGVGSPARRRCSLV